MNIHTSWLHFLNQIQQSRVETEPLLLPLTPLRVGENTILTINLDMLHLVKLII